jgi:hypothetical protein
MSIKNRSKYASFFYWSNTIVILLGMAISLSGNNPNTHLALLVMLVSLVVLNLNIVVFPMGKRYDESVEQRLATLEKQLLQNEGPTQG